MWGQHKVQLDVPLSNTIITQAQSRTSLQLLPWQNDLAHDYKLLVSHHDTSFKGVKLK
jgi:hypothetical protein